MFRRSMYTLSATSTINYTLYSEQPKSGIWRNMYGKNIQMKLDIKVQLWNISFSDIDVNVKSENLKNVPHTPTRKYVTSIKNYNVSKN